MRSQSTVATVSLAVDLGRYREHERVYGQYVAKMACLVDALQTIVQADRGRASELLQRALHHEPLDAMEKLYLRSVQAAASS